MTILNDASAAQVNAADPSRSTWVSANAGSGKTRVLTDRVARLLLRDVRPERILCLTYTKAAATHMQNQLFDRLGSWAMLNDQKLREALVELGESPEKLTASDLSRARTLFASALETPGGLKIQTIHSFCASLLRRFPLEAGVSPNFQEMDERTARRLRTEVLEIMALDDQGQVFERMAEALGGDQTDNLCREIVSNAQYFTAEISRDDIRTAFGLSKSDTEQSYLALAFGNWRDDVLTRLVTAMSSANITRANNPDIFTPHLSTPPSLQLARFLEPIFVYKTDPKLKRPGEAKTGAFPVKVAREFDPGLADVLNPIMEDFAEGTPMRKALEAAERTEVLYAFARPFLAEYSLQKAAQGWLDFDDLIEKAKGLLTDSAMAAWVLYKLDGGIDHILVDEAQDTSPSQWAVIEKLAEEFWAGSNAANTERTLFVVGDEKQSIYSFQGADPSAFDHMRAFFDDRLSSVDKQLNLQDLLYSFRSSPAILSLVDIALKPDNMADTSLTLSHRSFYADLPGRVDLWPFIDKSEAPDFPDWTGLEPINVSTHHETLLAEQIAGAISDILAKGDRIVDKNGPRQIVPGDFLILVQRRKNLFAEIIRCLKSQGLPVAGADRLKISEELAVMDLVSLLSFLATPEDDLALAEALKSPLFGLDEQALFSLAHGRRGTLWQSLDQNQEVFADCHKILSDLRNRADFLRPYDLLERLLVRHEGRARIIARLGREAEDALDAFLSQAMAYEQVEPPTLSGFLDWISQDQSELKREMDSESQEIRVMTVHGAKGLEAPIVILPDTASRRPPNLSKLYPLNDNLIAWAGNADVDPEVLLAAKEARKLLQTQERARLLYVALTRAESWLIVCGAGEHGGKGDSWYDQIAAAMQEIGAEPTQFVGQDILRFQPLPWPDPGEKWKADRATPATVLPDWTQNRAIAPKRPEKPRSPSGLQGGKALPGENNMTDEETSLARGRYLHALLEHLPGTALEDRKDIATLLARGLEKTLDTQALDSIFENAQRLLSAPHLQHLFGEEALREVPYAVTLNDVVWHGFIDVILPGADVVQVVDFKSNINVPTAPELVPEGILQQMGAYCAALQKIYPKHRIESAILWSETAELMALPHDIVTLAGERATTS